MGKYELKIITLEQSDYIKNLLDDFPKKDIHYHPDYLKLFQDFLGTRGMYVLYGNDKNHILFPYFERKISGKYLDLVSTWYFGGPTHNIQDKKLLPGILQNFRKAFNKYCQENNIVSEFQRLNPILDNYKLFQDNPSLYYDRQIVYVDLKKDLEMLYNEYSRHTRKNINKAKQYGLKVYHSENIDSISKFIEIYSEAMKRKNAKDFYYFNETFFNNLFKIFRDEAKLFQVEYDGKIISSSIELGKYGILYDYLRGSNPKYFALRPNDILIDEIVKWAKFNNYKYFVLGGGNSSSLDDGLFKFKKSFSSTTADFYVYKKVYNLGEYERLCKMRGKKQDSLKYEKASFFPEYIK